MNTDYKQFHEVSLVFFEDDAHGEYGLSHKESCPDNNTENPFNAFWDGRGLFHDVFEHWFENVNPLFKDNYAFNIGGECVAMGARYYYMDSMQMQHMLEPSNYNNAWNSPRIENESSIQESIVNGYCNFGFTLESNVPNMPETDCNEMEYQLGEFWKNVKDIKSEDEDIRQYGEKYKRSVTKNKIFNLYRYGYNMARELISDKSDCWHNNHNMIYSFITFFTDFCKKNDAEEMSNIFSGLTIRLYKNDIGQVNWRAFLINIEDGAEYELEDNEDEPFDINDFYPKDEDEE